jgi:tetratricopeptide (TPR) repeat protein
MTGKIEQKKPVVEHMMGTELKMRMKYLRQLNWLVNTLMDEDRPEEALPYARSQAAVARNPAVRAYSEYKVGVVYERLEDYEGAQEAYARAMRLEPTDVKLWYFIHNNRAYSLVMLRRFEEAENACREAILIDPLRHNAYKNLGLSLQGQGRNAEAARMLALAARINPSDGRALAHLEQLLEEDDLVLLTEPGLAEDLSEARKAVEDAR